MWTNLKNLCLQLTNTYLNPQLLLLDFEVETHTTANNVFKNIKIKVCRFHLCQAWYQKINSIPILHKEYKDKNSEIGKWLKMFFGLPYLPENLVSDAFNDILSEAPKHKKCVEFANYVLENYIDTEQFPPSMVQKERLTVLNHTTVNFGLNFICHIHLFSKLYVWKQLIIKI